MKIKSVGICGSGQMGAGIAQVILASGYSVSISDNSTDSLNRGISQIKNGLKKSINKGKIAIQNLDDLDLVSSKDINIHKNCDLVIEAVSEVLDIKIDIFTALGEICSKSMIICSNTSSLSLTKISAAAKYPKNVLGLHFFNPVPVIKLVEVIPAIQSSIVNINLCIEFIKTLGKTPCYVKDSPGFIANRILLPMINEAIFCLHEGLAEKETIDMVMKLGMAHPMGPLELADYIGLDTCLSILNILHESFGDQKYRASQLLKTMVSAGFYGRKSGKGFYEYPK